MSKIGNLVIEGNDVSVEVEYGINSRYRINLSTQLGREIFRQLKQEANALEGDDVFEGVTKNPLIAQLDRLTNGTDYETGVDEQ